MSSLRKNCGNMRLGTKVNRKPGGNNSPNKKPGSGRCNGYNAYLEEFIFELRKILQPRSDVLFAYIFGSFVKGTFTQESDIDIAVYLRDGVDPAEFVFSLMPEIVHSTGCDKIDLIVLNRAPLSLKYMVQKEGRLVFERDEDKRIDFETQTRLFFWDFSPQLEVYAYYMLQRFEEGTFGT